MRYSHKVARVAPYPAAAGYGETGSLVKLASNESAQAPLPAVVAAATAALTGINRYPDPTSRLLREALAEHHRVPIERIAVGNGSCDILLTLGEALLEPGSELVYAWPSFSVYPHLAAVSGATERVVPLNGSQQHDLEAMAAAVTEQTRLLIVANPNNPTSTAVALAEIKQLLKDVPEHVCVLLDEAYCEYNSTQQPQETLELLDQHSNLILLRTFSKVYGLCGLRVGYALCGSAEPVDALNRLRQPFFCNVGAQAAAVEALKHQDEIAKRVQQTAAARKLMEQELDRLDLTYANSEANFCWIRLGQQHSEQQIVQGLADQGVIVRSGTALGDPGHLRVTYGLSEQNQRFIDVLATLV